MPKKEAQIETLKHYLPGGAYDAILNYLRQYNVHLTISAKRKSILGDYRHRTHYRNHRISVNGNLNTYSFLITLLHELAHLLTFEEFSNKVQPHGREWKLVYAKLLEHFIASKIFPPEIEQKLLRSLSNPAASSCADVELLRILKKYDNEKSCCILLEELPLSALFLIDGGRIFKKGEKLRKRFKCKEIKTEKEYLFSPVSEVELVSRES